MAFNERKNHTILPEYVFHSKKKIVYIQKRKRKKPTTNENELTTFFNQYLPSVSLGIQIKTGKIITKL